MNKRQFDILRLDSAFFACFINILGLSREDLSAKIFKNAINNKKWPVYTQFARF